MKLVGRFLCALALYLGVVGYLTWPLAAHLGTHIASPAKGRDFDTQLAYWTQAWETQALATAPTSVLDAPFFHPARHALLFAVLGLGTLPIFAPVHLATGNPTLAGNLAWLLSVALTAASLHVVVRSWSGLESAGVVAGLAFLTTRWVYWDWIPVAPTYAAFEWLPPIVWLLARPSLGTRDACLLGVALALQCGTDLVYCAVPVLAASGVVALWRLGRRPTRGEGLRILGSIALATLLLSPLVVGYLGVRADDPNVLQQTPWRSSISNTTLPRDLIFFASPTSIAPAAAVLLVVGIGIALVAGAVAPRAWRHALLWVVVGTALSLGPTVILGHWAVPNHLDRLLRAALPIFAAVRRPFRLRATALIGLCLLAGLAFATVVRALERRWPVLRRSAPLLAVAMAVTLYASARSGWPAVAMGHIPPDDGYPLARQIGADDPAVAALREHEGPVLELPARSDSWGVPSQARAMYRALWHRRPLLNGYASYWPAGFDERMALAERLPDPLALMALRRATGLTSIVINMSELEPEQRAAWNAAFAVRGTALRARRVGPWMVVVDLDPLPQSPPRAKSPTRAVTASMAWADSLGNPRSAIW